MELKIAKDFRFLTLLLLFLLSAYLLLSSLLQKQEGVIVTSLQKNSRCSNLEEGFVISEVAGKKILSLDDLKSEIENVRKGEYVAMKANGIPAGCFAIADGDVGIEVAELPPRGLRLSNEIADVRVDLFEVKGLTAEEIENVFKILKIRAKKLKLLQTEVTLSDSLIRIANPQALDELFVRCELEIKISHELDIKNRTASIEIGNSSYKLKFFNESFEVDGSFYLLNQSFYLEEIKFELLNATNASVTYHATVVGNKDIEKPLTHLAFMRFDELTESYILNFPLEVSEKAEENVKKILKNVGVFFIEKQVLLQAEFLYFLDGKLISSIPISREFRREASILPLIASEKSLESANRFKTLLEACLSSGILEHIPEKIGSEFQKAKFATLAKLSIAALAIMAFIPSMKFYKKRSYWLLPSVLLLFETVIIFGIAALTQSVLTPGWVIDLPTFFGLIVAVVISLLEILEIRKFRAEKYLLWVIGLFLLFTQFRGFGLALIFWMAIDATFGRPLLKDFL